jgi:toxin ParE1/3/4
VKRKPVVPRTKANEDVEHAIAYYLDQQANKAALGFIKVVTRTVKGRATW